MSDETRRFPRGVVATPHHLASVAGAAVLDRGGNAVDAAVAANLVLGVVTPYHCGPGGDLTAIVWDGAPQGLLSTGAAPAAASPDQVRAAVEDGAATGGASLPGTDGMPMFGALSVVVPGAVAGWFALLERWGSRSFGDLAASAVALADGGFEVSPHAASHLAAGRDRLGGFEQWRTRYGEVAAGDRLRQPGHARLLRTLADHGPDAFYRGAVADDLVETLVAGGSAVTTDDFAAHAPVEATTLSGRFRGVEVLELPPPTQGVTALTAIGVAEALGPVADPVSRAHLHVEACRAALADRGEYIGDPAAMTVDTDRLLAPGRLAALADGLDPDRREPWPPATPAPGGTAYLAVADDDGLLVSLSQSNFMGFGSGIVDATWDLNLHNRGAQFDLAPGRPASLQGGRRPLHTLVPSLVLRDGEPWLVLGTMGGDGQPQIQLQLLSALLDDGLDLRAALAAPRWIVSAFDGDVAVEGRAAHEIVVGLRSRGHRVDVRGDWEHVMGHAQVIGRTDHGYLAGADPRSEGSAAGR